MEPDNPVAFTITRPIPLLVSSVLALPPGSTGLTFGQRLRSQPAPSHHPCAAVRDRRPAAAATILRKRRRRRRTCGRFAGGLR